jgi:hypothetical protein
LREAILELFLQVKVRSESEIEEYNEQAYLVEKISYSSIEDKGAGNSTDADQIHNDSITKPEPKTSINRYPIWIKPKPAFLRVKSDKALVWSRSLEIRAATESMHQNRTPDAFVADGVSEKYCGDGDYDLRALVFQILSPVISQKS